MISVVVPVFNEAASLERTSQALVSVLTETGRPFEIVYVNDGSSDSSAEVLQDLQRRCDAVRFIEFSRNFGKEIALAAGLRECAGDAVVMLDADGQHPPDLIPRLLAAWDGGAEVVVGVREGRAGQRWSKSLASWAYYRVLNGIAETKVRPGSTDYRLLDRQVVDAYNNFTERNRITRGLVDWLGFRREYVPFVADVRAQGAASYSLRKLTRLALDSFVSTSLLPLRLAGYLGSVITLLAAVVGVGVVIDTYLLDDPLALNITGTAVLGIAIVFLVGIILICLGLIALYIANIHTEVINRPLYVTRRTRTDD